MNTSEFKLPLVVHGAFAVLHGDLPMWRYRLQHAVRSPVMQGGLLAALALLALLLAYHAVVRQAVQQGDQRRMAAAAHSDAVWRCNALHGRDVRDLCLRRIDAKVRDVAQHDNAFDPRRGVLTVVSAMPGGSESVK